MLEVNNGLKQTVIDQLETAIDAESTLANCYNHLFSLTNNGKIRSEFKRLSDVATDNIKILNDCLKDTGVTNFVLENKCQYCKINPESFSLVGAINLGLEITDISIKIYKKIIELLPDAESKNLFKSLLKEKTNQHNFLKKESEFVDKDSEFKSVIDLHCIPTIASRLGK
jgi:rubrerythrin